MKIVICETKHKTGLVTDWWTEDIARATRCPWCFRQGCLKLLCICMTEPDEHGIERVVTHSSTCHKILGVLND